MIEIKTTQEALNQLDMDKHPKELIADVLIQTYIFDTCFDRDSQNKVLILEDGEIYETNGLIAELTELVGNYHKSLYIICDSGEGLIIYKKLRGIENV